MDWNNFSQVDLELLCLPQILKRGESYYREGHLVKACRFEDVLVGKLIGTNGFYQASMVIDSQGLDWECDCPYPDFCKHLAALAWAWLDNPKQFQNIDFVFEHMIIKEDLVSVLRRLVKKHPFDFIQLYEASSINIPPKIPSQRGILNLVRNLFQRSYLSLNEVEPLWEKIQGVRRLIEEQMLQSSKEAIEPLRELWLNLAVTYRQKKMPLLRELLEQMLQLAQLAVKNYDYFLIKDFFTVLCDDYFDSSVEELHPAIGRVIAQCIGTNSVLGLELLQELPTEFGEFQQLIAYYELLSLYPVGYKLESYYERLQRQLTALEEGRLWLLNRFTDEAPQDAYKIAKKGLVSGSSVEKRACREWLIIFYQQHQQSKQAAALCHIHFMEEPCLAEYLRLKELLSAFPQDFQIYRKKIIERLTTEKMLVLLIPIMLNDGDFEGLAAKLYQVVDDVDLLSILSDDLVENFHAGLLQSGVYQAIIFSLLDNYNKCVAQKVLRLIAAFKKCCLRVGRRDLWEEFGREVPYHLDSVPDYAGRIAALLSS